MPYDPVFVQPMREELSRHGFEHLLTPADVDRVLSEEGPVLVVVNSVCGCAAGVARPGVALSLSHPSAPRRRVTVFAGQELDATQRARSYFEGQPPSSPQVAIVSRGRLLFLLQRWQIEGRTAEQVATALRAGYEGLPAVA